MKANNISRRMKALWKDETGQGMSEYTLIITIVAISVIAIAILFRKNIQELFKKSNDRLTDVQKNVDTSTKGTEPTDNP